MRHVLPETSDFIVPSVVSRGDLTLAVSTGGKSPALAKKLRKDLSDHFGDEYAVFLDLMGKIRRFLLEDGKDADSHKRIFDRLVHGELLDMIKDNRTDDALDLLADILGRECVDTLFENDEEQK